MDNQNGCEVNKWIDPKVKRLQSFLNGKLRMLNSWKKS